MLTRALLLVALPMSLAQDSAASGTLRCVRRLRRKTPWDVADDKEAFASAVEVGPCCRFSFHGNCERMRSGAALCYKTCPVRPFVRLARFERRSLSMQKGRAGTPVAKKPKPQQPSLKPSRRTSSGAATPSPTPQVRGRKANFT
jgi:hypothetical protein